MKQVWGNGEHATALTVAEMRAADAYTIAHFTPGRELMRRAAEGVYGAVAWHGRTAILAGGGNNGGDGYALAGILAAAGMPPDVFAVSEKLSEDGRFYREQAQARGVRILPFNGETSRQVIQLSRRKTKPRVSLSTRYFFMQKRGQTPERRRDFETVQIPHTARPRAL